jgi:hypothetical protein
MRLLYSLPTSALFLALLSGCADLTVPNENEPDLARALSTPADVEAHLEPAFRATWNASQWYDGIALSVSGMSWEHANSWGCCALWQMSWYPRSAWKNDVREPYYDHLAYAWASPYEGAMRAAEGLQALEQGGPEFADEAGNARLRAYAHFALGNALGLIASTFDHGMIPDTEVPAAEMELRPYPEVMNAALSHFREVIRIAGDHEFQFPDHWINGNPLTSDDLARLAHSYMARYMAENARYPDERDGDSGTTAAGGWEVDWAAVVEHADQGITSDFMIKQEPPLWWDDVKIYGDIFAAWSRASYPIWGRADVSGGYEAWMAEAPDDRTEFLIVTPDQRYPQGSTVEEQRGNPGLYLVNIDPRPFNASRGTYYFSYYRNARYDYYSAASYDAETPAFNVEELDLLRAEGLYRLGDRAGAAELINRTRVARGGLPPVTAAGIGEGPTECVPRRPDGACGDLFDALKHEKRVENVHTHLGSWYFDSRGWGELDEGTPVMVPVPAGEIELMGVPPYTFGGVGGNCAAGAGCQLP